VGAAHHRRFATGRARAVAATLNGSSRRYAVVAAGLNTSATARPATKNPTISMNNVREHVIEWEIVPVPKRNIGGDRGNHADHDDEAEASGQRRQPGLSQEPHRQKHLHEIGHKLETETFREVKRRARRLVQNETGRVRLHLFHDPLHPLLLLRAAGLFRQATSGKGVEPAPITDRRGERRRDGAFIRQIRNARFSERCEHVSRRLPDEHGDSPEQSCEQKSHRPAS